MHQRERKADAALEPLRKSLDRLAENRAQIEALDGPGNALARPRPAQPPRRGDEIEEALRSHVGVERRPFGQVADRFPRRCFPGQDIAPAHRCAPRVGLHEPGDDAHGRRLAGAVRPEKAQHLAPLHGERDPVDRVERPVALAQRLCFYRFRHPHSPFAARRSCAAVPPRPACRGKIAAIGKEPPPFFQGGFSPARRRRASPLSGRERPPQRRLDAVRALVDDPVAGVLHAFDG